MGVWGTSESVDDRCVGVRWCVWRQWVWLSICDW